MCPSRPHLEQGQLSFTVESRVLRELGERLVKEPEVAFVELIKNSHDADATTCTLRLNERKSITIEDDGDGMTLEEFKNGWMRIGTSSKTQQRLSRRFNRVITGEKGIGRFAVRFLGKALSLRSVANDPKRGVRTLLTAEFNWPEFDRYEDLGHVKIPFVLDEATEADAIGTSLTITRLRPAAYDVNLDSVRSASLSVVSPFQALLAGRDKKKPVRKRSKVKVDPGFSLNIDPAPETGEDADVASTVLNNAVLRAVVTVQGSRVKLRVYGRASGKRLLSIDDRFPNSIGDVYADVRFFPDRKGTFADLVVKGPVARGWVRKYHGVAVFDRNFRVLPYGTDGDDWLGIAADVAINERNPKSSLAEKHFPMSSAELSSTRTNYMLRLPHPRQLVGIVSVEGRRAHEEEETDTGLIPAADREGFVHNDSFHQLWDVIRGAVEAIAHVDRDVQLKEERAAEAEKLRELRAESRAAIREIQKNPRIRSTDKRQIVERLVQTQRLAEEYEERTRETKDKLEIMSLLGVVAGFMTHEFGVALDELRKAKEKIAALSRRDRGLKASAEAIDRHLGALKEFVTYTQGYIQGAMGPPARVYPARPRIQQVIRVFGRYADQRGIDVQNQIAADVDAPLVPVSLYNGIALNLYTNALKAVMAKSGAGKRLIVFTAENDDAFHTLTVADTGIGIPDVLRSRVFDPLFTTTSSNRDPLGSGLGLGLTLVKRAVDAYGGTAEVVRPPEAFATAVRIRLPLARD